MESSAICPPEAPSSSPLEYGSTSGSLLVLPLRCKQENLRGHLRSFYQIHSMGILPLKPMGWRDLRAMLGIEDPGLLYPKVPLPTWHLLCSHCTPVHLVAGDGLQAPFWVSMGSSTLCFLILLFPKSNFIYPDGREEYVTMDIVFWSAHLRSGPHISSPWFSEFCWSILLLGAKAQNPYIATWLGHRVTGSMEENLLVNISK